MKPLNRYTSFLLSIFLLLSLQQLPAQIKGKAVYQDGTPATFIHVLLYQQADSAILKGTLTDEAGQFQMEGLPEGEYYLALRAIGYKQKLVEGIQLNGQTPLMIPAITMEEDVMELAGVELTASRMEVTHNKEGMVVNVQSSLLSKGSTILELVERAPGVSIDRRNGDLLLNGQGGTLIMINGKVQQIPVSDLIQMLNGMDGSQVEKIELITNPSAKYDAEGGAIINIQLGKSELLGTHASISLNLGRGWGNKMGGSIHANHSSDKLNIYGNYALSQDNSFSNWHAVGSSVVPVLGGLNQFDFSSNNGLATQSHNSLLGLEYDISADTKIGASIAYNVSKATQETNNLSISSFINDSVLVSKIRRNGRNNWQNGTANFFFRKELGNKASFGVDLDYITFGVNNPNEINNEFLNEEGNPVSVDNIYYATQNRGNSETNIDVGILKMDYQKSFENGLKIETGLKTSYSLTINSASIYRFQQDEWQLDERTQSEQSIKERIGAAYLSLDYSLGEHTSLNMGMRYERWQRDFSTDSLDRTFGRFFPTLFITRKIGEFTNLQFNYNRRIARPSYNDLASFLSYNGPISVFTGNSSLLATLTDNFKLSLQKGGKNLSLFFRHEANPIYRYQISRNADANLALISPQNAVYQNSFGLETYLPFQLTQTWSFNIGGSLARRFFEVNHTEVPKKAAYNAFNLNGSTSINFPHDISFELSGWYQSTQYNGSIRVKGFGVLNTGIKKDFGSKYGSLQFTVNDLLKSFKVYSVIGDLTQEAFDSKSEVVYMAESGNNRIFRLSYTLLLGKQGARKERTSKKSNDEENRIIR